MGNTRTVGGGAINTELLEGRVKHVIGRYGAKSCIDIQVPEICNLWN